MRTLRSPKKERGAHRVITASIFDESLESAAKANNDGGALLRAKPWFELYRCDTVRP